jgi:hypothetical protein
MMVMPSGLRPAQYRWSLVSRVTAAIAGGYVLTSLLAIALALLLTVFGMNKAEAVLAITMASFLMYALIVMAVFHAATATRAWLGLAIAGIPPAVFAAIFDRNIPWASLFAP